MLKGLRTHKVIVGDLARAKRWYASVLGHGPYFDEPFYVGFDVGGYELGLVPASGSEQPGVGGTVAYWGVDDADEAYTHLLALGATAHEPVSEVGGGIRIGSVLDPDGNEFGVIYNPNFLAR